MLKNQKSKLSKTMADIFLTSSTSVGSVAFVNSCTSKTANWTEIYDYVFGSFPETKKMNLRFLSRNNAYENENKLGYKPSKHVYQKVKLSAVQIGPDSDTLLDSNWFSYHVPISVDITRNHCKCKLMAWYIGDPEYKFNENETQLDQYWILRDERLKRVLKIIENMMETADIIGLNSVPFDIVLSVINLGVYHSFFVQWMANPSLHDEENYMIHGLYGNCESYCPIWRVPHHILFTRDSKIVICKRCQQRFEKSEHYKGNNPICKNCMK